MLPVCPIDTHSTTFGTEVILGNVKYILVPVLAYLLLRTQRSAVLNLACFGHAM